MYPYKASYTPSDDDTDGFANDVSGTSGEAFTLAATTVGDGLAHFVIITPSGSVTGSYTLTGTDADGIAQTETLATDTVNAVTSTKYYKTLTSVLAPSGIGANTVDIGWTDDAVSPTFPLNWRQRNWQVSLAVALTGTINYTVEHTFDQLHPQVTGVSDAAPSTLTWWAHDYMYSLGASADGNYSFPVSATRLKINGLTAGATIAFWVTQGM